MKNSSLFLDIIIMMQTVKAVVWNKRSPLIRDLCQGSKPLE